MKATRVTRHTIPKFRQKGASVEATTRPFIESNTEYTVGAQTQGKVTRVYTLTGGSGEEDTTRSYSMKDVRPRARALYHRALREVPAIKAKYGLGQSHETIRGTIRSLFERYRDVTDSNIADVLLYKGKQEMDEVQNEYKGKHHLDVRLMEYEQEQLRVANEARIAAGAAHNPPSVSGAAQTIEGAKLSADAKRLQLAKWQHAGLIPKDIRNWAHYERWRMEQDEKFRDFAAEQGLFNESELEANERTAKKEKCSIM